MITIFQIFWSIGGNAFKMLTDSEFETRNRAKVRLHRIAESRLLGIKGDDEKGEFVGTPVPVLYEIREKEPDEDKWKSLLKARRVADPRARRKGNETTNFRMSKPAIATKEEIEEREYNRKRQFAPSVPKETILGIVDRYSKALIFPLVKEATLPIIEKYSDRDKGYDNEYGGDGLEYLAQILKNWSYNPEMISRDIKSLNDKDYRLFLNELQKEFKNIRNLSYYQGEEEDYKTGTFLGSKGRRSESADWPNKFRYILKEDESFINDSSYETVDEYWEDRGITADRVLTELTSALDKVKSSLQGRGLFNNAKKVFGDYSRKIVRGEKK